MTSSPSLSSLIEISACFRIFLTTHLFFSLFKCSESFIIKHLSVKNKISRRSIQTLFLYDINKIGYEKYNSDPNWKYFLLEEDDLDDAAEFALNCFYEPKLKIKTSNMFPFEAKFWGSIESFFRAWDRQELRSGNKLGFKSRGGQRLLVPSLMPTSDSLILAALSRNDTTGKIVGLVEVCLEKADGKLTPALRYPWDSRQPGQDQPYLCNLCIDPSQRRRGLGTDLCRLAERMTLSIWGLENVFLHVELKNEPAQKLYVNMGYRPVNLFSSGERRIFGLDNILYYGKNVSASYTEKTELTTTLDASVKISTSS